MNLSQQLLGALSTRRPSDELLSLYSLPCGGGAGVAPTVAVVTLRAWAAFARELASLLPPEATTTDGNAVLDAAGLSVVGLLCAETFAACLVESVCFAGGWPFCVFNPADPARRLEGLVARGAPMIVLNDDDVQRMLERAMTEAEAEEMATAADNGAGGYDSALSPSSLCTTTAAALLAGLVARVPDSAVAYYIHTSGSTAEPKCVVATRGNIHSYVAGFTHSPRGLDAGGGGGGGGGGGSGGPHPCRILCLSTPFFDPSIGDLATVLLSEGAAVLRCTPRESIARGRLALVLRAADPTHLVSTPAVWRSVQAAQFRSWQGVDGAPPGSADCFTPSSAVQPKIKVFLGGEKMPQSIIDDWADAVELYNVYGVTEVTVYQSLQRVLPGTLAADVSCGAGGAGTDFYLERAVEEGEVVVVPEVEGVGGEVVMTGPQVCAGYAATGTDGQGGFFTNAAGQRCFRTGDMGVWRRVPPPPAPTEEEGDGGGTGRLMSLFLRGRRDWQVKISGQRTSLEEVEQTIQRVFGGALAECCCCTYRTHMQGGGHGSSHHQEQQSLFQDEPSIAIGAGVVLAGSTCDAAQLAGAADGLTGAMAALLGLYFPPHMIPSRWLFLPAGDRLPQTVTGKVSRNAIAGAIEAAAADGGGCGGEGMEFSARTGTLAALVHTAWCGFFGLRRIPRGANFFLLGGDSLGALKLTRGVLVAMQRRPDAASGGTGGIDAYGGLPAPFQPHVLINCPTLAGYVAALETALRAEVAEADRNAAEGTAEEAECPLHVVKAREFFLVGSQQAGQPVSATAAEEDDDAVDSNSSILLDAVSTGSVPLVRALLEHRLYDINGGNSRHRRCTTPLHLAVTLPPTASATTSTTIATVPPTDHCQSMTELLLSFGARPTTVTADGVTPVHLAAAAAAPTALECLLASAPETLHCRDYRQQSLLHFAAREGRLPAVQSLLWRHGVGLAGLAMRDKWQRSPAHWAALNRHTSILAAMVEYVESLDDGDGGAAAGGDGSLAKIRRGGSSRLRFERLAKRKTSLVYESLLELADRVSPGDERVRALCEVLTPLVES